MKALLLPLVLVSTLAVADVPSDAYHFQDNTPGHSITIDEVDRTADTSLIRVNTEDKGMSAFSVVDAAVAIGNKMGKTHFALINGTDKQDGTYIKIFFTSDPKVDPTKRFANEMSEDSKAKFKQHGYMEIAALEALFKKWGQTQP